MKIRMDFVTNSSSSSFLLAFRSENNAYAELCKAYMKVLEDEMCDYEEKNQFELCSLFHNSLEKLVFQMSQNKISEEDAIELYLMANQWKAKSMAREKLQQTLGLSDKEYQLYIKDHQDMVCEYQEKEVAAQKEKIKQWLCKHKAIYNMTEIESSDAYMLNIIEALKSNNAIRYAID